MQRFLVARFALVMVIGSLIANGPVQASILTFEVFDPALDVPPFNNAGVLPNLAGYGYPEGFGIPPSYGDGITATSVTLVDGTVHQYGVGGEGFTPNVNASYGPFSIFTGGPQLWREGFGDLNGVLYQGSRHLDPLNPVGTDYNVLEVVLYSDPGFDVVLYGLDLASFGPDRTINSITVYDGVPFPFLTPTNDIFESLNVDVPGMGHLAVDFGAGLQSNLIWLRIDANNLGADSENIGIDNIRFGQVTSSNTDVIDPDAIDDLFQSGEVPEATSALIWIFGLALTGFVTARRWDV